MILQYLLDPKVLRLYLKSKRTKFGFHMVRLGNIHALCLGSLPIVTKQFNPNFKIKFFFLTFPIVSVSRKNPISNPVKIGPKRQPRLYINIGSLPYFDNGSGIPRVAKELCYQGLSRDDISCIPVYAEPCTGTYRIPLTWLKKNNWHFTNKQLKEIEESDGDPVVTVQKGDRLIHTMVNNNEIRFMTTWLNEFRDKGGKVGFILYDLIPENYPHYYRHRDVVLFRKWLMQISHYDCVLAISQTTKHDYLQWCQKHAINPPSSEYFYLGANFKTPEETVGTPVLDTFTDSVPYFLMVGTLEPRKGHAQVLDAFELLWSQGIDVRCVFVGKQGWKVADLCQRIRHHKEWNRRLIWLDNVQDNNLPQIYRGAQAVIVASAVEGFGLSVVEAMYYQKQLVLRDIPVFREIAGYGPFYFHGNDAEALSIAIKKALRRNNTITEKKYPVTWTESFDQFFKVIQKLTS